MSHNDWIGFRDIGRREIICEFRRNVYFAKQTITAIWFLLANGLCTSNRLESLGLKTFLLFGCRRIK